MTKPLEDFLYLEEIHDLKVIDRFVVLLWWHQHSSNNTYIEFSQLCDEIEEAGFNAVNRSRDKSRLAKDKRTVRGKQEKGFRLNPTAIRELDSKYLHLLENKPVKKSNSLLQRGDFQNTRSYIKKVVLQVNASYDASLFDCCAVMLRRLLETLIIEIYEAAGRDTELKGHDGHFMMFAGLLNVLEKDTQLNVGRTTIGALKSFKKLADNSAHNRRYNATKKHIDDVKQDTQLAVTELLALAFPEK